MSLDKVVADILSKGEEKKEEIIRMGMKERDELVAQAEKRISEVGIREGRRAQAAIAQMERQELSSAELESKKAQLGAQKQVMEELKGRVLEELRSYPPDKRKKLYSKLAARARKELGECYAYSNKDDQALLQLPAGISVGGIIDCGGGLVFESKDRAVRLDFRFETMLDDVWGKRMHEIYGKLFG